MVGEDKQGVRALPSDRATAVEPVPVSPLRDGIPSAARVQQMIREERFILDALTHAYQARALNYAHFSPAWDATACRVEALVIAAQGIEARSDETPTAAQPEGREPGPKDAPNV